MQDAHDVGSGKNDTKFECDLPGVGAWRKFALLHRRAGLTSEQVSPLLLDTGDFIMDTSRARPDLGGCGDEEAAAGEDAPLYVREKTVTQGEQTLATGSVAPTAGATTSVMKLSRAALMVASWSSSLEPNSA